MVSLHMEPEIDIAQPSSHNLDTTDTTYATWRTVATVALYTLSAVLAPRIAIGYILGSSVCAVADMAKTDSPQEGRSAFYISLIIHTCMVATLCVRWNTLIPMSAFMHGLFNELIYELSIENDTRTHEEIQEINAYIHSLSLFLSLPTYAYAMEHQLPSIIPMSISLLTFLTAKAANAIPMESIENRLLSK